MANLEVDDSLGFLLNKVNSKLKNKLHSKIKSYNITPEQWGILNFLWSHEGITPKELSDLTLKDKPNTNRILEHLIKKNLILRKGHPKDKRSYQLFLTTTGKNLRMELAPIVVALLEQAIHGIERKKIEELKVTLNAVYANLN